MTERVPAEFARSVAGRLVAMLSPACSRIEIAGSLRRGRADVKDIEIVCVPSVSDERDLFGELTGTDALRPRVDALVRSGVLSWRVNASNESGRRFYALRVEDMINLDLFAVLAPAQWGAIFAIRTGPAEYSQAAVTRCRSRGLRCVDGHLERVSNGSVVPTPEEVDFFRACGVPFVPPERRT